MSGKVSVGGKALDEVSIDIYENNASVKKLYTNDHGSFSFIVDKGNEYLLLFYKEGFTLQSASLTVSKQDTISDGKLFVSLEKDKNPPEGLYFNTPSRRITPDSTHKGLAAGEFSPERIKPKQRADTVMALLSRAQAAQYALVADMRQAAGQADTAWTPQMEKAVNKEIARDHKIRKNDSASTHAIPNGRYSYKKDSTSTETRKRDEELEAERGLAGRLAILSEHYQLEEQKMLARARLDDMDALRYQHENQATDTIYIWLYDRAKRARSKAVNDRYQAMEACQKSQAYTKEKETADKECSRLIQVKNHPRDSIDSPLPSPPQDRSDNLSKLTDKQRTHLIQKALEEEERFKNYREKTEQQGELTVKDIHVGEDDYEMQVDKTGNARYFKNGKPITKITFDFETTRRMVDVLNTIRQVDKFEK